MSRKQSAVLGSFIGPMIPSVFFIHARYGNPAYTWVDHTWPYVAAVIVTLLVAKAYFYIESIFNENH